MAALTRLDSSCTIFGINYKEENAAAWWKDAGARVDLLHGPRRHKQSKDWATWRLPITIFKFRRPNAPSWVNNRDESGHRAHDRAIGD